MPDTRPDTELNNPQSTKPPLDPHLKALENEVDPYLPRGSGRIRASGDALFDRQGFVRPAASGAQGLLSRPRALPAAACEHRLEIFAR